MSYVHGNLAAGERVLYEGRMHWIAFARPVAGLVLAFVLFVAGHVFRVGDDWVVVMLAPWAPWAALVLAVLSLLGLVRAAIQRWATEIAITNRRVIAKTGWISRDTSELHIDRVEGANVDQSVIGRLLGYGTVTVTGTGAGTTPMPMIADPLAFRAALSEALTKAA
ncbi:MAG: PH domain-containing protein [Alphaproteobacteria bacterium]